jgi:hypothetical protein
VDGAASGMTIGPIVLRRPRRSRVDVLIAIGVTVFLSLAAAILVLPLWLGLRNRGVSWAWIPLLFPAAVMVFLIAAELWASWRRSRERIVIDRDRRRVDLRRVILGGGRLLFGRAGTRGIPFEAIVTVQSTDHGHGAPGAKLVVSEQPGVVEKLEIMNDEFDRGRLSAILLGELSGA